MFYVFTPNTTIIKITSLFLEGKIKGFYRDLGRYLEPGCWGWKAWCLYVV